jgi:hypothetical protein
LNRTTATFTANKNLIDLRHTPRFGYIVARLAFCNEMGHSTGYSFSEAASAPYIPEAEVVYPNFAGKDDRH